MFLIAAIVLLLVLPSPGAEIAFAVCLVLAACEVYYWWRKVRGRRVQTGAETLIGSRAEVVSGCRPEGQVVVDGALWNARCAEGADPGEHVTVTAREGLLLIVSRER